MSYYMILPETHKIRLRFGVYNEEPPKKWMKLKKKCEAGNGNEIVRYWLYECKLQSNRDLLQLDRSEGGITTGGDISCKQIRFREQFKSKWPKFLDNDIVMDQIYSTETEQWTIEELDDLIYGFKKFAREHVDSEFIFGHIEIENKDADRDDSDSD